MKNRRIFWIVLLPICVTGALADSRSATWGNSALEEVRIPTDSLTAKCLQRENGVCTVCGIEAATNTKVSNKTRTSLLTCRGMKPGPAKLVMETRAEPVIPGLWEVEFGFGYHTSAKEECPHQFIASNNPPLRAAYEIGPISIDAEIPPDGIVQPLVCVGLSSARVGGEGKETGASLNISKLKIVSQ
jgi:hypothetical protein